MMSENELVQAIQAHSSSLKTIVKELEHLEDKVRELARKNSDLSSQLQLLEKTNAELSSDIEKKKAKISELENEIRSFDQKIQEKELELTQLRTEHAIQEQEAELLRRQFEELSDLYQEDMDAKELLAIYITLLERVFGAKPHAKILYVLHGESPTISRDALNKSLGFEPAVILRAIHELQSANLVEYDDQQNVVSLTKRIYK